MLDLHHGLQRIERLILILRHCDNLQWKEIADLLGLSELRVEETYFQVVKDQFRCLF